MMTEWQPIETAPKDGTEVLGAWYLPNICEWQFEPIKWRKGKFVVSWDFYDDIQPTNWMSLPEPPYKADTPYETD
jgi:hypothetical protein